MYAEDSFFTLTMAGRIGLMFLSTALTAAVFLVARVTLRRARGLPAIKRLLAGFGIATGLFWVFVWLSPQIYYLYYQMIFDGLPWQIVVGPPPGLGHLVGLLAFAETDTLSDHSKGVLGWALFGYAIAVMLRPRNSREMT